MIYSDVVLAQLQSLVKASAPPLLEVATGPLEEPEWVPGQTVTAFVLTAQQNGRFQVRIGDHVLDMNLPRNTQPGEHLDLTFVSNRPRPTFVLSRDLAAAIQQPAQRAAFAEKTPVTLSDTARFLGTLLQKMPGPQEEGTAALSRTNPLVNTPPGDVREFANVLREALAQSGLFYESHQAQWVAGERPLADLLREPQGRLSRAGQVVDADISRNLHPAESGDAKPTTGETRAEPDHGAPIPLPSGNGSLREFQAAFPRSVQDLSADLSGLPQTNHEANPPAISAGAGISPEHPVHPDTTPLVQQQLHALDARQLVWQGQVWQGQAMEWTVEERLAREHEEQDAPTWQTSLRLKLPRLGDVKATLVFIPQGLRVSLSVAEADAGQAMQRMQDQLRLGLEAVGLSMLGMTVEQSEIAG